MYPRVSASRCTLDTRIHIPGHGGPADMEDREPAAEVCRRPRSLRQGIGLGLLDREPTVCRRPRAPGLLPAPGDRHRTWPTGAFTPLDRTTRTAPPGPGPTPGPTITKPLLRILSWPGSRDRGSLRSIVGECCAVISGRIFGRCKTVTRTVTPTRRDSDAKDHGVALSAAGVGCPPGGDTSP